MSTTAHITDDVLAGLVDRADDAVIIADAAGTIQYWNAASERMFGYSREQAIGSSLDLIIPEKLRDRHWEGYWRVMATGRTAYAGRMLAVPALRADGSRISIEFTVTLPAAVVRRGSHRIGGSAISSRSSPSCLIRPLESACGRARSTPESDQ
jgi:PAS domain S-box-containing protein